MPPDARNGFAPAGRSAKNGFTLIEVLVALVVTSLIVGIVMNAALQAKTRAVAALDKEQAVMLARALIADRSVAPFDAAQREGQEGRLRWSVNESPIASDPGGLFLLTQIDASVRNGRGVALARLHARKLKTAPRS
jgi:prepilin-type N-terminal cleavage/methylation domain-containing protein